MELWRVNFKNALLQKHSSALRWVLDVFLLCPKHNASFTSLWLAPLRYFKKTSMPRPTRWMKYDVAVPIQMTLGQGCKYLNPLNWNAKLVIQTTTSFISLGLTEILYKSKFTDPFWLLITSQSYQVLDWSGTRNKSKCYEKRYRLAIYEVFY